MTQHHPAIRISETLSSFAESVSRNEKQMETDMLRSMFDAIYNTYQSTQQTDPLYV